MNLEGLSHALSGVGKFIEKNPESAAHLLGTFGQALSMEGTWQHGLGGAAAGMGQQELQRQMLQDLFGGQQQEEEEEGVRRTADMPFGPNVSPMAAFGPRR